MHDAPPLFKLIWPIILFSWVLVLTSQTLASAETESWETLNSAGMLAYQEKDFLTAKELFERALDTLNDDWETNPRSATTLNNLAAAHENLGEYEQAEMRYRNALSVIEAIQGPDHPDVALELNNLASLYFSQKAFSKAEPLWKRALAISEAYLGEKHPHLVQSLVTLGIVTQYQRKFEEAEGYYLRAIRITEHALNPMHAGLIPLYYRYATLLRQSNRESEADVIDQRIQSLQEANKASSKHPD